MNKEIKSISHCLLSILVPFALSGYLIGFKNDLIMVIALILALITMICIFYWSIVSLIKGFKNIGQSTMLIVIFDMLVFILAYLIRNKNGLYISMVILPIVTNIYVNVKIIYSKNAQ